MYIIIYYYLINHEWLNITLKFSVKCPMSIVYMYAWMKIDFFIRHKCHLNSFIHFPMFVVVFFFFFFHISSSSGRHFYTRTYEYIFSIWKKVSNDEALLEETLIDPASIISYWMSQLSNVDNAMHQFNILKTFKQINFFKNNIEKFDIFICTIKISIEILEKFWILQSSNDGIKKSLNFLSTETWEWTK